MKKTFFSFLFGVAGFILFAFLYYLPLLLDSGGFSIAEPRVGLLIGQSFSSAGFLRGLFGNFLGGLTLLVPCYLLLRALGGGLAVISGLSRALAHILVFGLGWLLMLSVNASFFPLSNYSYAFENVAHPEFALLVVVVFAVLVLVELWCFHHLLHGRRWFSFMLGAGLICVVGAVSIDMSDHGNAAGLGRNVIIVGVDSLSATAFDKAKQRLPNLRGLLDQATVYSRAYTPEGRTFPAWISILSGKPPVEHGAVFNLRNLGHVQRENLLTWGLRRENYRTVFAIDERRFNNLDESFGFDQVVGPNAGALDFILQRFNDAPLANLILQLPIAKYLFPFSYTNTASYVNYDAGGFVDSVLGSTAEAESIFLAVHFESAHFPFKSRHVLHKFQSDNRFWSAHLGALTVVDEQVGALMRGLAERGYLKDALLIVLSDHGEGLGEVEAAITKGGLPSQIISFGHGSNLLSDHQNRIVLGVLEFKDGKVAHAPSVVNGQVSLLGVRSLIEKYVKVGSVSMLSSGSCMIVETGIRFAAAADYRTLSETNLAEQSAGYYEIDGSGLLRIKEQAIPDLVAKKDVGWRCRDHLTYYSFFDDRYFSYRLDSGGLPIIELEPIASDIQQIAAYRYRSLVDNRGGGEL